jgi:hypothetical protein
VPTDSDGDLNRSGNSANDERKPFRIVMDVLATKDQIDRLHDILGELLCGAPPEHDGPCRIAWDMGSTGEPDTSDPDDVIYGYDADAAAFTREHLSPIEVWNKDAVDRSLGLQSDDR